jgi:hypothetical protein
LTFSQKKDDGADMLRIFWKEKITLQHVELATDTQMPGKSIRKMTAFPEEKFSRECWNHSTTLIENPFRESLHR